MDIADFIPYYPYVEDVDFNKIIFSKKEFRDIKIEPVERITKGQFMSHQILLSRLLSSYTPYDGMLLFHEMGSGKSCTVIAAIKKILNEKNGIDSYIYVASNEGLLGNFKDEMDKCSGDSKLSQRSDKHKTETIHTFINRFEKPALSNHVIVIDEVHNIRQADKADKEDVETYTKLHSILHKAKNCKIILLSGTPMMNDPNEIASIMNLILPLNTNFKQDNQLNFQKFNETFFDKKGNLRNTDALKKAFKGRISYLKAMTSDVTLKFIGTMTTKKGKFTLDPSLMEDFQTQQFKKITAEKKGTDFFLGESMAMSDMVLPDGFTFNDDEKKLLAKIFEKIPFTDYNAKIEALRKYSCKYADSIKTILKARNEDKSVFVFNERVNGTGLRMFALILRYFGFNEFMENARNPNPKEGERFILMTGKEPNPNHNNFVRNAFNLPQNSKGKYIRVILASSAISEGYSFQNVQVIDIHSPWFNFSKTAQAIARGIRAGSHQQILKQLKELKVDKLVVDVHLRVSIPKGTGLESIEVNIYNTAETKDLMIKQIEHVIKEESIDARFNFERNKRVAGLNSSRDCDYTICDYKPFPNETPSTSSILDCSSFLAYYYGDYFECEKKIIGWFQKRSSMTLNQMLNDGYINKRNVLLWTLNHMINTNTVVFKKYTKLPCYLREEDDIYFLVYDFAVNKSKELDSYYVNNTHFVPAESKHVLPKKNLCDTINLICEAESIKQLNFHMRTLTAEEKEEVLESNLLKLRSEIINEKFKGQYGEINGTMYSWYLLEGQKTARKMVDKKSWEDCTDNEIDIINEELKRRSDVTIDNAKKLFGADVPVYYGTFVYTDEWLDEDDKTRPYIFKLVKLMEEESTDKRKAKRGQNCMTLGLKDVLKPLAISLKIPYTADDKQVLCDKIKQKLIDGNAMIRD